jgi:pimeloyl-ACP methyl ester carboxylesterase
MRQLQKWGRKVKRCGAVAIAFALSCSALFAGPLARAQNQVARAQSVPPPHKIDLDEFDRAHRIALLPNGMRIAYVDSGNRHGRPVVLIHGYTDNARDWVPLIPYLDPRFRLIVIDDRGHGRSGKPECCYARIDFAYDVRLLLDRLGIDKADIVGHSMGGIIAQTFAEFWPERTRRVVLISSPGGSTAKCDAAAGIAGAAGPQMDYRAEIARLKEPIDPESPFMIEWWSSPTPVDADFLRRQRRDAAAIPLKVWLAVLDQALGGADLQSTLPRLTAPVLLIWGGKDQIIGPRGRCALHQGLSSAEERTFPDYGHNPHWEDPAALAAVINPFLSAELR